MYFYVINEKCPQKQTIYFFVKPTIKIENDQQTANLREINCANRRRYFFPLLFLFSFVTNSVIKTQLWRLKNFLDDAK